MANKWPATLDLHVNNRQLDTRLQVIEITDCITPTLCFGSINVFCDVEQMDALTQQWLDYKQSVEHDLEERDKTADTVRSNWAHSTLKQFDTVQ